MILEQLANTLSLSKRERARFVSGALPLSQCHHARNQFDLESAQLASLQLGFSLRGREEIYFLKMQKQ